MNILKECENAERIGISGHNRPDGDCIGSCLALFLYLSKCMPNAYVKVFLETPGEEFTGIKGCSEIDSSFPDEAEFDVFFVLDCERSRLGDAVKYFDCAKKTINIDHHISNAAGCGDVNYVMPNVGSTSELTYDLIDKDVLDRDMAQAIYVGMVHDTGVFQYSNTTPDTLRKAAHLISFGFNFSRIIEESFYQKSYIQSQIMGRALLESLRFLDGKCIVSCVDRKTMDFYNATSHDLEGIVNQLRNIKGIECAIFMYEINTLEFKVSLRSTEKVDVSKVAAYFGGGGHMRAAGCILKGTFHDCVNNLSLHIEEQLC